MNNLETATKKSEGRYPHYVPHPYRIYLKTRKVYRQLSARLAENQARRSGAIGVEPDGPWIATFSPATLPANPLEAKSKGAWWLEDDLARPELKAVAEGVEGTKKTLAKAGLRYTNTAATFLPRMFYPRSERTKLWENAVSIYFSGLRGGERVLDVGGASTPFSFHLAHLGCEVHVLDNDWANCGTLYNANYVATRMNWKLRASDADISRPFPRESNSFDRVFSICTIEHLPSPARRMMMREVGRVLKPGGVAAITFCYDRNHPVLTVDKGLRFGYWEKFCRDLLEPSGLSIDGPFDRTDDKEQDFLGVVILRKEGELRK